MVGAALAHNEARVFQILQDGVHRLRRELMDAGQLCTRDALAVSDTRQSPPLGGGEVESPQRVIHGVPEGAGRLHHGVPGQP